MQQFNAYHKCLDQIILVIIVILNICVRFVQLCAILVHYKVLFRIINRTIQIEK